MSDASLAKLLILTAAVAWLVSLVIVPLVRALACRVGLVDSPDPTRKLHRGEIALGGGIAVFLTLGATMLAAFFVLEPMLSNFGLPWGQQWTALSIGGLAILALGIIDDRFALRGKQKLGGQVLIVAVLAWFWQPPTSVEIFGLTVELGVMAYPMLALWLLVCINAVNLIDGADGAAGSFGLVASLGIAFCAFVADSPTVAVAAVAIAAALAGFLCFNRPPATIFLGDAGSMLLGLLLGSLACWSVQRGERPQDLLIPITLMGVPLFDSAVAVLRRVLTGRSIYMADRGHLHHILGAHLKVRNLSPMWMLIAFAGLTAVTSLGALVGVVFGSDVLAVVAMAAVVFGMVWSRMFGHAEAQLLASHTRRVGGTLVSKVRSAEPKPHISGVPLQGDRQWDGVWLPLVEFATKNGLGQLKLDLNLPWQHEGYHGYWTRGFLPEKADQWSVKLPIICQRRSVGRLEIIGRAAGQSQLESLEAFSYLIAELQPEIERMVEHLAPTVQAPMGPPVSRPQPVLFDSTGQAVGDGRSAALQIVGAE